MSRLFISEEAQTQFERDGFVKIPLLDAREVQALVTAYESYRAQHERIGIPYITTSHSNDPALITAVDTVLQATLAPAIARHMQGYNLLFGNYLVKMPVEHSATPPHQDITFVDERKYASVNIWVALQNIDKDNGGMYFLKGSHKFMYTIRPTHYYKWPYENVKKEIIQESVSFSARAGDAFVFDHGVIHGSHANTSPIPRLAAVVAAYSSDAELIHYFLPPGSDGTMQKYRMNKNAYLFFEKEKPPVKGVYIGDEWHDFAQLDRLGFYRLAGSRQSGLVQRVKSFFSQIK